MPKDKNFKKQFIEFKLFFYIILLIIFQHNKSYADEVRVLARSGASVSILTINNLSKRGPSEAAYYLVDCASKKTVKYGQYTPLTVVVTVKVIGRKNFSGPNATGKVLDEISENEIISIEKNMPLSMGPRIHPRGYGWMDLNDQEIVSVCR